MLADLLCDRDPAGMRRSTIRRMFKNELDERDLQGGGEDDLAEVPARIRGWLRGTGGRFSRRRNRGGGNFGSRSRSIGFRRRRRVGRDVWSLDDVQIHLLARDDVRPL
jgi:hypothetical protein